MNATLPATPAARFRRALRELDALGVSGALVRSCCTSCGASSLNLTGPELWAVEMDGTANDPRGWFRTDGAFTGFINWANADLDRDAFLSTVALVLTNHGLTVELPADDDTTIIATVAR